MIQLTISSTYYRPIYYVATPFTLSKPFTPYPCNPLYSSVSSFFYPVFSSVSSFFYPLYSSVSSLFYPLYSSVSSFFYPCFTLFFLQCPSCGVINVRLTVMYVAGSCNKSFLTNIILKQPKHSL